MLIRWKPETKRETQVVKQFGDLWILSGKPMNGKVMITSSFLRPDYDIRWINESQIVDRIE
jgi:hypothetical protein